MDADLKTAGTIAITGATGFLGRYVLRHALASGHKIQALTRRKQPPRDGVKWYEGTLAKDDILDQLCHGADYVLHIAGVVNAPDRQGFVDGNIDATANMIAAATKARVKHFVHISSLAARIPELSTYGWSKYQGEQRVVDSGLNWSIIRPPGIYGPGDTELLDMFKLAQKGFALLPPRGRVSLIHADDMARLILAMTQTSATGAIWEADDGHRDGALTGWTHRAFAHAIGRAVGRDRLFCFNAPAFLLKLAAQGDRLIRGGDAKLTPDRARYLAHPDWTVDHNKTPPAHIWQPAIPLEDGLKKTVSWYRDQGWLG